MSSIRILKLGALPDTFPANDSHHLVFVTGIVCDVKLAELEKIPN